MRICLFTVSLNRQMTGIDKVAVELANEMVNRGHQVSYISHPGNFTSDRLSLDHRVTQHTINQNYSNKTIKLLKSIIKKEKSRRCSAYDYKLNRRNLCERSVENGHPTSHFGT